MWEAWDCESLRSRGTAGLDALDDKVGLAADAEVDREAGPEDDSAAEPDTAAGPEGEREVAGDAGFGDSGLVV